MFCIERCRYDGSVCCVNEPTSLDTLTMRPAGASPSERQHCLRDGNHAKYVCLEHSAHLVEATEFGPNAIRARGNGCLIRYVELDGASIRSDALGRHLAEFEVARADQDGQAAGREVFRNLQTDSFVRPGHEGDERAAAFHRLHDAVCAGANRLSLEVAPRVGLYDQSQLTRHFGRIVGTTPARYANTRQTSGIAT